MSTLDPSRPPDAHHVPHPGFPMSTIDSELLAKAFVSKGVPMFSTVAESLVADKSLSQTRVRDLTSGLRGVAKALGRPLDDVPADPRWLQPRLSKIAPGALGLSSKSWSNLVSNARAAMAHFGIVARRQNRLEDLTADWRELWSAVLLSGDATLKPALCRFVHFLNGLGVAPEYVADEHAALYRAALEQNEISRSPEVAFRAAVNGWNLATKRIPSWPKTLLPLPLRQMKIMLPEEVFPETFIEELDRLLDALHQPDPFISLEPQREALSSATVKEYRRRLLRFASDLVHAGVAPDRIQSLNVLVEPTMAELGLRQMLARNNRQTNRATAAMATLLRTMSGALGVPEASRQRIVFMAKRVALKQPKGLTRKNRDRLRVFQEEANLRKLLRLPEKLQRLPIGRARPYGTALAREDAVAIGLLTYCPIRVKNLAQIHIEKNLHRPGDGRVFLVFEADEVKNHQHVEFELPAELHRMIDRHLRSRAPLLCPPGTPWLFPRRDGNGPIDPNQLSSRLAKRIRKETGLVMNAHLFRHLAVMTFLEANPGAYEAARRLIGHSAVSQTLSMYSGLEVRAATDAFARIVAGKKK